MGFLLVAFAVCGMVWEEAIIYGCRSEGESLYSLFSVSCGKEKGRITLLPIHIVLHELQDTVGIGLFGQNVMTTCSPSILFLHQL